ncbi:uncharacterized protein LOC130612648 [Hydractinia symbiolongicarpus]|uniref:uncharacterized protein LOC130612648 n=1 Tax=Hydractinia symbiolongicarpus TaxID=13093 RepID=UPI00254D8238|nr:uncharacterized protein LOC130612648 [Hydractinia symbiolongicarpus]
MGSEESKPQPFSLHSKMVHNHTKILTGEKDQQSYPETIEEYCQSLVGLRFHGQTSDRQETDTSKMEGDENLGQFLLKLDEFMRSDSFEEYSELHERKFLEMVKPLVQYRKRTSESENECFSRLKKDGERFLKVYKNRGKYSEELSHNKTYWGSRQQLLSGKVIADWVDSFGGPMDPVFGVLLNPTSGRVGPGDTSFLHKYLFDNNGIFAYHAAVHDAFGYLFYSHGIGPGYDYLNKKWLSNGNMFAGQLTGLWFWSKAIADYEQKYWFNKEEKSNRIL